MNIKTSTGRHTDTCTDKHTTMYMHRHTNMQTRAHNNAKTQKHKDPHIHRANTLTELEAMGPWSSVGHESKTGGELRLR